jgi:type 1 glutamine amidotransferase
MKYKLIFALYVLCQVFVSSYALAAHPTQFKVLLLTKTGDWHHSSQYAAVPAIEKLAKKHHFAVDFYHRTSRINDENLKQYDVIMFLLTSGEVLNKEEQAAMQRFIQAGKGFVGVHSASDTEYDWPWYTKLVGRMFHTHPTLQTAKLKVLDRTFPGLARMPDEFLWTEEWYEFGDEKIKGLKYILSVDEKSYDPALNTGPLEGDGMGKFHPMAWYHDYDGGRSFYSGLGHLDSSYSDDLFMEHLYGGLYWAATGKGVK